MIQEKLLNLPEVKDYNNTHVMFVGRIKWTKRLALYLAHCINVMIPTRSARITKVWNMVLTSPDHTFIHLKFHLVDIALILQKRSKVGSAEAWKTIHRSQHCLFLNVMTFLHSPFLFLNKDSSRPPLVNSQSPLNWPMWISFSSVATRSSQNVSHSS